MLPLTKPGHIFIPVFTCLCYRQANRLTVISGQTGINLLDYLLPAWEQIIPFSKMLSCSITTEELTCRFHEVLTLIWASKPVEVDNHSRDMEVIVFLCCCRTAWESHTETSSTLAPQCDPPQAANLERTQIYAEMMSYSWSGKEHS